MTLNRLHGLALKSACLFWLALSPAAVLAQQNNLFSTLDDFIRAQTQGLPGKVAFTISQLDARTQLTPCNAFEPFVPQGGKLWGKTTVGVRCLGPSNWTIYVPVQVSITGNYLVAARNFQVGSSLTAADIVVRSGDLSTLPSSILTDPAQAIGKTVKNGVGSGQPLRSDQLIAPWAVQQGQSVKTVSNGPGFSVSSDGKALNNATEGQIVQVRTASGQTVSGVARTGGVVEVSN
jgi:flagella basal body P-ring formation protein FlgA